MHKSPSITDLQLRMGSNSFITLNECNIKPSDLQDTFTNCEIDSKFKNNEISLKINHDINTISLYLEECFKKSIKDINKLIAYICNRKGNENIKNRNKFIQSIKELLDVIQNLYEICKSYKGYYKSLHPVLRLGGYRSLLICIIESLHFIISKIDLFYEYPFPASIVSTLKKFVPLEQNTNKLHNHDVFSKKTSLDKDKSLKSNSLTSLNDNSCVTVKFKHKRSKSLNLTKTSEQSTDYTYSYKESSIPRDFPNSFCSNSNLLLSDLCSKLIIIKSIPNGKIFENTKTLQKLHPKEVFDTIIAYTPLGYKIDHNLKQYSKKMKVIYCSASSLNIPIVKQMKLSLSAAFHLFSKDRTISRYSQIREDLNVNYVRKVWNLLEDPVTSFFAKQLGFAPSFDNMITNCEIQIPVLKSEINNEEDNPNGTYHIKCMFISPFIHTIDKSLYSNGRDNFIKRFVITNPNNADKMKQFEIKNKKIRKQKVKISENDKYKGDTVIIHIHGGGWVSQSPGQHLPYLSEWAKTSNLPAISIDYSLSPEYKYPISVNECYAVFKWLQWPENREKLGFRTDITLRAIICGDSAGGNLACAITIKSIQNNIIPPIGLLLHYPALNLSDSTSLSRIIFSHDPILNTQTQNCCINCYLAEDRINNSGTDPIISPLIVSNEILSQFPNTVISIGDIDPLIDDATILFKRLQENNVRTVLRIFNSLPHGFLNLPTQLPKSVSSIHSASKYMKWLYEEHKKTL